MTWKYLQCLLNLGHRENLQRVLYTVFHHVYSCSIFSSAGRRVNCSDDDDWISCGCICNLKIFAVFIEHSEKLYLGQWMIDLQCVLCTVFHHVYSCSIFSCAGRTVNCSDDDDWISCGCVCGLLLGRNFERWMIGKKKEESKQSSRVPWIMEVYQSRNKMKIDDSDFKWIHHMREFRYWQYGHWSWLFIKMILFFLLLDLSESSFIKQSAQ